MASWAAVTGATSYQLERTHPQEGVDIIYNGPNTSSSQLIYATGLVKFRVKACNSAGCSTFSAYQSIMLHSGSDLPLAKPMEIPAKDQASNAQEPTP